MLKNISDGIFHSSSEKKRICSGNVETNTIFTFLCIVRNLSQSFAAEGIEAAVEYTRGKKAPQKAILNAHSAESCFTTDIPRRKFQLLQRHFHEHDARKNQQQQQNKEEEKKHEMKDIPAHANKNKKKGRRKNNQRENSEIEQRNGRQS